MKTVIQRVNRASVTINDKIVAEIEKGMLILLGISVDDDEKAIKWLTKKIINLRIFEDESGKMNLSLKDVGGKILLVSQFTLYANAERGNRSDFLQAAKPDKAIPLYEKFIENLKSHNVDVKTGIFGADMKVELINNGPVTIILER